MCKLLIVSFRVNVQFGFKYVIINNLTCNKGDGYVECCHMQIPLDVKSPHLKIFHPFNNTIHIQCPAFTIDCKDIFFK